MQIFKLTLLHLKRMIKKRQVLILTLLMPTFVICIVTFFTMNGKTSNNNTIYVDFVNNDRGTFGAALQKDFESNPNISITTVNETDAVTRVQHNTIDAAVIIPENFSQSLKNNTSPSVKIMKLNSGNSNLIVDSKVNSFIKNNVIASDVISAIKKQTLPSNVSLDAIHADLVKETSTEKIQVHAVQITVDKTNSLSALFSVNLVISFMMFTVIFIVNEITERRNDGTLKRSLASPNSNVTIAGSYILAFLIIGWLQVILMIGTTSLLFKFNWGNSFIGLFLLFTSLIFVILGMGLLLCRFIKSENNISTVAMLITQVTCMLGGSYMPVEYFPDILKKISYFMPQSWAVDALTNIALKNKGALTILPDVGILLLFAAAFFTASASALIGISEE